MAANSNPALCTHPNPPTARIIDGGWSTRELAGYAGNAGITTTLGNINKVAMVCPDCGWVVEEKLVNPDEIAHATDLSAAAPGGTSPAATVALNWADVPGADSYKIEKSTDGGSTWVAATPATSTSSASSQTGLATGSVKFRVKAVDNGVDGSISNVVTVTIP